MLGFSVARHGLSVPLRGGEQIGSYLLGRGE